METAEYRLKISNANQSQFYTHMYFAHYLEFYVYLRNIEALPEIERFCSKSGRRNGCPFELYSHFSAYS